VTNPADWTDVRKAGLTSGSNEVVQEWLDKAWRALNVEIPSLGARLTSTTEPSLLDVTRDVVVSAAMRVLRNPEGAAQREGAIDDWRESVQLSDSTQDLYFTAAELRRLAPAGSAASLSGSIPYLR
jgi:hypothetical protein